MSAKGHLEDDAWNKLRDLLPEYANQGMGLPSIPIQLPTELKFYIRDSVSYLTKRQIMRPYYLLIFVIQGEQHFQVEDQEIILHPGELFILLPFTRHNFFNSPHFPARALFISFVSQDQDSKLDSICGTILKLRHREIRALRSCALMSGKAFQKDAGYGQECVMAFMLFLFSLIRRFSPDNPAYKLEKNALPRKIELMRQIIAIIHKKNRCEIVRQNDCQAGSSFGDQSPAAFQGTDEVSHRKLHPGSSAGQGSFPGEIDRLVLFRDRAESRVCQQRSDDNSHAA